MKVVEEAIKIEDNESLQSFKKEMAEEKNKVIL
jgi:hypothetical protein